MRLVIDDGNGRRPVQQMSMVQNRQAIAIADCVGRLIPQEGVDYDIEVIFKGENSSDVSMGIVPHTDKGEFWRDYVTKMISKYPPTMDNPTNALEEAQPKEPESLQGEPGPEGASSRAAGPEGLEEESHAQVVP